MSYSDYSNHNATSQNSMTSLNQEKTTSLPPASSQKNGTLATTEGNHFATNLNIDGAIQKGVKADGYLAKNMQWVKPTEVEKSRLVFGDTKIATAEQPNKKHLGLKLLHNLTHVKYKQADGNTTSINIKSLIDRTHTSVIKILTTSYKGTLNDSFIRDQIEKREIKKDSTIIKAGSKQLTSSNPELTKKQASQLMKEAISEYKQTMGKSSNSSELTFKPIANSVFVFTQQYGSIKAMRQSSTVVGKGSFGKVTGIKDIFSKKIELVEKQARGKPKNRKSSVSQIRNEHTTLTALHSQDGKKVHIRGVQKPPYRLVGNTKNPGENETGYITNKYDFDLTNAKFLKQPFNKRLMQANDLVKGLAAVHKAGYIHGDIKPANCCSDHGELQLADFGGAVHTKAAIENKSKISPAITPAYMHEEDIHLYPIYDAKNPDYASEATDYFQKHDVHCLGMTLLEILSGADTNDYLSNLDTFELQTSNEVRLAAIKDRNPEAAKLIGDMLKSQAQRPNMEEVERRYQAIVDKLPQPKK